MGLPAADRNRYNLRVIRTRLNGALFGLPAFALDPNNPTTTGIPTKPQITIMDTQLEAPEATQYSLGMTTRLGNSGLYLDLDGIYVEGDNEIILRDVNFGGNSNPVRPNKSYTMINVYTNEGRSEYKALIASLNGTLKGGHLITASFTWADKKNISDDFSPAATDYPSDPADIEAEWGRSRADERYRIILSGVFRLPWQITLAPIYEYGSGQPWNPRLGYDYNGDLRNSDREPGVDKYSEDGPDYNNFSLRITKSFRLGDAGSFDLIVEGFNLLDSTNYDPDSISSGKYRSGPTVLNPSAPYVANPNYGNYLATLPPREIQLGLRFVF